MEENHEVMMRKKIQQLMMAYLLDSEEKKEFLENSLIAITIISIGITLEFMIK